MKALAILTTCLALAVATPSRAAVMMGFPHHTAPHLHAQPAHGPSSHFHHRRNDETGLGFPQEVPDFTPGIDNAAVVNPAVVDPADEPVFLPPAQRCPAVEPVVVRSSGPHILYIGQKPPVQANLPKVIYGTD
jgi:hypothetical protein